MTKQNTIAAQAAKSSKKARLSAARLAAVQAVYQMTANAQGAQPVIEDFISTRLGKPIDGEPMIVPDGVLFREIVAGVEGRRDDLETLIAGARAKRQNSAEGTAVAPIEPLLAAVLLCGGWELLARLDTDAPIIISDYMRVAHAFFDQGETKLVNGVLDHVRRAVRDNHNDGAQT